MKQQDTFIQDDYTAGYLDGASAERLRMAELLKEERNDAIDACIKICGGHWNIADWLELRRKLEALKR